MKKLSLLGLSTLVLAIASSPVQAFTPWSLGETGFDYTTTDRGQPSTPRVFDRSYSPFIGDKRVKWLSQTNIKSGGTLGNALTFGFDSTSYPDSPWFVSLNTNGPAVTGGSFRFRMTIDKSQNGLDICTTTTYCNNTFNQIFFASSPSSGSGAVFGSQAKIYLASGDTAGPLLATITNGSSDTLFPEFPNDIIVDYSWTSMNNGSSNLELSVNQTVPAPLSLLAGPVVFASVNRLRRLSSRLKANV